MNKLLAYGKSMLLGSLRSRNSTEWRMFTGLPVWVIIINTKAMLAHRPSGVSTQQWSPGWFLVRVVVPGSQSVENPCSKVRLKPLATHGTDHITTGQGIQFKFRYIQTFSDLLAVTWIHSSLQSRKQQQEWKHWSQKEEKGCEKLKLKGEL